MDGFECAQKIKDFYENKNQFFEVKVEFSSFRPYLIACSALINHQIEQKALNSGFDLVVESPLTVELLKENILIKSIEHRKK